MSFTTEFNILCAFYTIDKMKEKLLKAQTETEIKLTRDIIKDTEDFLERIEIGEIK